MKKHRKPILAVLCFMAVLLLCGKPSLNTLAAASDTAYRGITLGAVNSKTSSKVKVGKYYLWMEVFWYGQGVDGGKCLKVAKSKSAKGTTIASRPKDGALECYVVSNGEKVYYVSYDNAALDSGTHWKLMQVDLGTKKSKVLRKGTWGEGEKILFYGGRGIVNADGYAYGKYVYYKSKKNEKYSIVRLDTKTKKTKVIAKNIGEDAGGIMVGKGQYMYIETEKYVNGDFRHKILVYDCKNDKLHTVYTNNGCFNHFYSYKDKIYLLETDSNMKCHTIYGFNLSGSGKKTIKKLSWDSYDYFFNDGYLYYNKDSSHYERVNLKTKKVQKISKKQFESKKKLKDQ